MALVNIFTDIADAIREKTGTTDTFTPTEMADAIADIPTGVADVTNNLFDKTQLIEGMCYDWQHNWIENVSTASYFIPVIPGDTILMAGAKNWGTSGDSVFVDSNKAWISNITSRNASGGLIDPFAKTAPNNAAFICATVYIGDADYERFIDRDTLDVRIWS